MADRGSNSFRAVFGTAILKSLLGARSWGTSVGGAGQLLALPTYRVALGAVTRAGFRCGIERWEARGRTNEVADIIFKSVRLDVEDGSGHRGGEASQCLDSSRLEPCRAVYLPHPPMAVALAGSLRVQMRVLPIVEVWAREAREAHPCNAKPSVPITSSPCHRHRRRHSRGVRLRRGQTSRDATARCGAARRA